jgi:succinate-acetate transporter protein
MGSLLLSILMLIELLDLLLKSHLSESLDLSLLLNGLFTLLVLGKGMSEVLCLQLGFSVLHMVLHLM